MSDIETVSSLRRGDKICVDLRQVRGLGEKVEQEWRAEVAKLIGDRPVIFTAQPGFILHEKGDEFRLEDDAIKLDSSWEQDGEFYTPEGLRQLIDQENSSSFELLVAQLRSPMGVVPFVGAGLSVGFGFPSWPKFLTEAAVFHSAPEEVLAEITKNRLIDAATLLYDESSDRFQRLVERAFGGPVGEEQVRSGAVSLLPLLARGPVITTNFDHVLEAAYQAAEAQFENIVTGKETDSVIRAMHRNQHVLIKMHGDASDRSARVFTGLEYDKEYSRSGIPTLARIMFTNRPLLFLGCSLDKDRVLDVLNNLHQEIPGLTHYAVLAASYSVKKLRKRRCELDQYGICPLWFVPQDFKRIEGILQGLLQESSTRLLWKNTQPEAAWPKRVPSSGIPSSEPRSKAGNPEPDAAISNRPKVLARLAQRMASGRMIYFLGAGVHLDRAVSARGLYQDLANHYQFSEEESQRAEVAQYIIDREGRLEVWAATKRLLEANIEGPGPVHELLADLPAVLRHAGGTNFAPQCFLTTNYDTFLEEALAQRGERFHLLYYQGDGKEEGRFVHRDLDGSIRVLEKPGNVRSFDGDASIVVKVDGGIPWDRHIPETVAISPLDFSISTGRLLTALPEAVRELLRKRSLLILGSSLRDAHIQRLVRWSAGDKRTVKTWAIQKDVTPNQIKFWSAAGVELIDFELRRFVQEMRGEIGILLGTRI